MDILFLFIGLAIGAVIGWLLGKNKSGNAGIPQEEIDAKYVAKERFADAQQRASEIETAKQKVDARVTELSSEVATWMQRYQGLETKLAEQKS